MSELYFDNTKKYFGKIKAIINKDCLPSNNDVFITKHTNYNFNVVLNCFVKNFQIKEDEFEKSKFIF